MMDVASSANVYSKGSLLSYDKDWCHGKLTRAQAEEALKASGSDCFLIREDGKALVLSLIHHGHVHHVNIKYGPGWYELESGSAQYSINELDELVSFYSSNPISNKLKFTLGVACKKTGTIVINLLLFAVCSQQFYLHQYYGVISRAQNKWPVKCQIN